MLSAVELSETTLTPLSKTLQEVAPACVRVHVRPCACTYAMYNVVNVVKWFLLCNMLMIKEVMTNHFGNHFAFNVVMWFLKKISGCGFWVNESKQT